MINTKNIKVLIADDDERILSTYKMIFKNFNAIFVENGYEAIEMLKKEMFHVVITDYNMPKATGLEVIKFKKENQPECAGILVSGQLDVELSIQLANMKSMLFDKSKADILEILNHVIELYKEYMKQQEVIKNSLTGSMANQFMHDSSNSLQAIAFGVESSKKQIQDNKLDVAKTKLTKVGETVTHFQESQQFFKSRISGLEDLDLSKISILKFIQSKQEEFNAICQNSNFEYIETVNGLKENDFIVVQPILLTHVLHNLITNAIHANKDSQEKKWIKVSYKKDYNGNLSVEVMDCGKKLSPEIQSKLFKEKFTTKGAEGTGNGLMYCKKNVESFFGKITYKDYNVENCCFEIQIPIQAADFFSNVA